MHELPLTFLAKWLMFLQTLALLHHLGAGGCLTLLSTFGMSHSLTQQTHLQGINTVPYTALYLIPNRKCRQFVSDDKSSWTAQFSASVTYETWGFQAEIMPAPCKVIYSRLLLVYRISPALHEPYSCLRQFSIAPKLQSRSKWQQIPFWRKLKALPWCALWLTCSEKGRELLTSA